MPNIPGSFVLEVGFNQPLNQADTFDLGFWGSRTMNIYYQLEQPIGNTKFSLHPGAGFGLERYKFANDYTITMDENSSSLESTDNSYSSVRKSMLITNYFDVLLELRFSTNPQDPVRSFHVSVGGRAGYLFDSFTKIKYSEDGETKKDKIKGSYYLNDFRYGGFFKVGAGNFSVFSYYNASPLFKTGKGPQETDMTNFTVGISLSSF